MALFKGGWGRPVVLGMDTGACISEAGNSMYLCLRNYKELLGEAVTGLPA